MASRTTNMKRKLFSAFLIVVLSTLVFCATNTNKVSGATSSFEVKVGYFGGPFYTKTVFSTSDLEAMGPSYVTYTYIDRSPAVVYSSAYGVPLERVMDAAGIDVGSISDFSFKTSDSAGGDYTTYTKPSLIDAYRYYYPDLGDYFDPINGTDPAAEIGKIQVPTLLAITNNWQRYYEGMVKENFSSMTTDKCIRLMFGQSSYLEASARDSAKFLTAVVVKFGGAPTITTDVSTLDLKVGSKYQIQAIVAAPDPFLATAIKGDLSWSSSDPSVAVVASDGSVEVLSEGSVSISVTYVQEDGTTHGTAVAVTGSKTGGSGGSGSTGAGGGDTSSDGKGDGDKTPFSLDLKSSSASDVNSGTLSSIFGKSQTKEGGSTGEEGVNQGWRSFQMSDDSVELGKIEEKTNGQGLASAVAITVIGLLGAGGKVLAFRAEMGGIQNGYKRKF